MKSSGPTEPAASTTSIAVIHFCRPCIFFQLLSSRTLTDALEAWLVPTAKPDSSMLYICNDVYRCSIIRARTASNHLDKVSLLTPSLALSIWRVQTPLILGCRVRNFKDQFLPNGWSWGGGPSLSLKRDRLTSSAIPTRNAGEAGNPALVRLENYFTSVFSSALERFCRYS